MRYESEHACISTLTFTAFERWLEKSGNKIKLGDEEKKMFRMCDEGNNPTNLAFLISDQCDRMVKVAVYSGKDKSFFKEKAQFSGSVVSQLDAAYRFIDKRGYPEYAVKESIANALIHRNYSLGGGTMINVFDDRIEIVSLGGLPDNISLDAVLMGASQPVNPYLMEVFGYLGLAENFGTGIARILCSYADVDENPVFEAAGGCFRVTLPKCAEMYDLAMVRDGEAPSYVCGLQKIPDPKNAIYEMACKKGIIVRKDVQELLGVKTTRAFDLIKEMCDEGLLRPISRGRSSYYEVICE